VCWLYPRAQSAGAAASLLVASGGGKDGEVLLRRGPDARGAYGRFRRGPSVIVPPTLDLYGKSL
jgi:hypothetical protein